jgi:hypothetical protein
MPPPAAAAADKDAADFALLEELASRAGRCAALRCDRFTRTTGTTCPHCKERLCYEHGQPEAHGCGDAARTAARAAWLGGGGSVALGHDAPKPLKGEARAAVAKRMADKLAEKAEARKTKGGKPGEK